MPHKGIASLALYRQNFFQRALVRSAFAYVAAAYHSDCAIIVLVVCADFHNVIFFIYRFEWANIA